MWSHCKLRVRRRQCRSIVTRNLRRAEDVAGTPVAAGRLSPRENVFSSRLRFQPVPSSVSISVHPHNSMSMWRLRAQLVILLDFRALRANAVGSVRIACSTTTSYSDRRSLRRHQPLLRQQPGIMVTAPPTSLPRLRPVRVGRRAAPGGF